MREKALHPAHTVLVVAPDDELRRSIAFALEAEGFVVSPRRRLSSVVEGLHDNAFDCAVVDEEAIDRREGWGGLSPIACPIVLLIDRLRNLPGHMAVTPLAKPLLGRDLTETVARCIAESRAGAAGSVEHQCQPVR